MDEQIHSEELVKRGETCVLVSFRRSKGGILINVKAHPHVEALLRAWGDGSVLDSREYNRGWRGVGGQTLWVYNLLNNPGVVAADKGWYRIDQPGNPQLFQETTGRDNSHPGGIINISFLRLQGISEPAGVSFEIPGAFSLTAIRQLGERIKVASKRLYTDYLLPIDLTVMISTQETRL